MVSWKEFVETKPKVTSYVLALAMSGHVPWEYVAQVLPTPALS